MSAFSLLVSILQLIMPLVFKINWPWWRRYWPQPQSSYPEPWMDASDLAWQGSPRAGVPTTKVLRSAVDLVVLPCRWSWRIGVAAVWACQARLGIAACQCPRRGHTPSVLVWQGLPYVGVPATEALRHIGGLGVSPCPRPCSLQFWLYQSMQ